MMASATANLNEQIYPEDIREQIMKKKEQHEEAVLISDPAESVASYSSEDDQVAGQLVSLPIDLGAFVAPVPLFQTGDKNVLVFNQTGNVSSFLELVNTSATMYNSSSRFTLSGTLYMTSSGLNLLGGNFCVTTIGMATSQAVPTSRANLVALQSLHYKLFVSSNATQSISFTIPDIRAYEPNSDVKTRFWLAIEGNIPSGAWISAEFAGNAYLAAQVPTLIQNVTLTVAPAASSKFTVIGSADATDAKVQVDGSVGVKPIAGQTIVVEPSSTAKFPIIGTNGATDPPISIKPASGTKFTIVGSSDQSDPSVVIKAATGSTFTVGGTVNVQPTSSAIFEVSGTVNSRMYAFAKRDTSTWEGLTCHKQSGVTSGPFYSLDSWTVNSNDPIDVKVVNDAAQGIPVSGAAVGLPLIVSVPLVGTVTTVAAVGTVASVASVGEVGAVATLGGISSPVSVQVNNTAVNPVPVDIQSHSGPASHVIIDNTPLQVTTEDRIVNVSTQDRISNVTVTNNAANPVHVSTDDVIVRVTTNDRVVDANIINQPQNPVHVSTDNSLVRVTTENRITNVSTEDRVVSSRITNPANDPANVAVISTANQPVHVTTDGVIQNVSTEDRIVNVSTGDRVVTVTVSNTPQNPVHSTLDANVVSSRIVNPSDDPAKVSILNQPVKVTTEDGSGIFTVTTNDRVVLVDTQNRTVKTEAKNFVQNTEANWVPEQQDDGIQECHNYVWDPQQAQGGQWVKELVDEVGPRDVRLHSISSTAFRGMTVPIFVSKYASPGIGQHEIGMLGAGASKGDGPLTASQRLKLRNDLEIHPLAYVRADPAAEAMLLRSLASLKVHQRVANNELSYAREPESAVHTIDIGLIGAGASVGDGPHARRSPRVSPRSTRDDSPRKVIAESLGAGDLDQENINSNLVSAAESSLPEAPVTASYFQNMLNGESMPPSRIGNLERADKEARRAAKGPVDASKPKREKTQEEKALAKGNAKRRLINRFQNSDDFLGWILDGPRTDSSFKRTIWAEAVMNKNGPFHVATTLVDFLLAPEEEPSLEVDLERFSTLLDLLTSEGTLRLKRANLQAQGDWREFKRAAFYSVSDAEHNNRILSITRENCKRVAEQTEEVVALDFARDGPTGQEVIGMGSAGSGKGDGPIERTCIIRGQITNLKYERHKGTAAIENHLLDLCGQIEVGDDFVRETVLNFYPQLAEQDRQANKQWKRRVGECYLRGVDPPQHPGVCMIKDVPWYFYLGNDILASCLDYYQWHLSYGHGAMRELACVDYDYLMLSVDSYKLSREIVRALGRLRFHQGKYALQCNQSECSTPTQAYAPPVLPEQVVNALGGWVADLTEQGVEPNPGPPMGNRPKTFQQVEAMRTLTAMVDSLGTSASGGAFRPEEFIGNRLAGFASNTANIGLSAINLSVQDFTTVGNNGIIGQPNPWPERVVIPGSILHFFEVSDPNAGWIQNPNNPQVVGAFELTGYQGTSEYHASPPISPTPAVAQVEQILTMSSYFQNNRRFANGLNQADAACTIENVRQIVSPSIATMLLKLEGYRAIMSLQVSPSALPFGNEGSETDSFMRVAPANPPQTNQLATIGSSYTIVPNRRANDNVFGGPVAGRILPPWQDANTSDAANAFSLTFHASLSTVPVGKKAIQIPNTLVNMTLTNIQCNQQQSRMLPLVIYLLGIAPFPMFTPLLPIATESAYVYDTYANYHVNTAMPHTACVYYPGYTDIHILLPMSGSEKAQILNPNDAVASTLILPVPGPAYVPGRDPALANGAYVINAGVNVPLVSYRLDDFLASYLCNTATVAGTNAPCLVTREMFTQVFDAMNLLTGSDTDADYAWSQTCFTTVRYNPMMAGDMNQPAQYDVTAASCPDKSLWNGTVPSHYGLWAQAGNAFRDIVLPAMDLDYLNALASGLYTSTRNPVAMVRTYATELFSIRNMWIWSLAQAAAWQTLYAYHAIPASVWMDPYAGKFPEMEEIVRGHFLTNSQFGSTGNLLEAPALAGYADIIASYISGWAPMRDAAGRTPNENFLYPSNFQCIRAFGQAAQPPFKLKALNPGMVMPDIVIMSLFDDSVRDFSRYIQANVVGNEGQRLLTQKGGVFLQSADGNTFAIPSTDYDRRYANPTDLLPRQNDLMYNYTLSTMTFQGVLSDWTGTPITPYPQPIGDDMGFIPPSNVVLPFWRRATLAGAYGAGLTTIRAPDPLFQYNNYWLPCAYVPPAQQNALSLMTLLYLNIPAANLQLATQTYAGMRNVSVPTIVTNDYVQVPAILLGTSGITQQSRLRSLNGRATPARDITGDGEAQGQDN